MKLLDERYKCRVEGCKFVDHNKKLFSKHLYDHIKSGISMKCPFQNCKSKTRYDKVPNLSNHILRSHNANTDVNVTKCKPDFLSNVDNEVSLADEFVLENHTFQHLEKLSQNIISSLYLALESKFFVTNKSLQFFIDGMIDINDINRSYITKLLGHNEILITPDMIKNDLFSKAHDLKTGYLRSKFIRHKFYKNKFNYVAPKKIEICEKSFFYYVSIVDNIKSLFNNENFSKQYFSPTKSLADSISDVRDGLVFKNNPFFLENEDALQIILYQDSFEICNPLGSSKIKHKIVGIYMVIGNIPTWHRSKVEQIVLVALIYEKDFKKVPSHLLLHEIIKDLKILEDKGVLIENKTIRGSLAVVVGDNLGNHQIGGFNENFHPNSYFCRFCYIQNLDSSTICCKYDKRTKDSYMYDVNMSETCGKAYRGVKHNSVLNKLSHFHVCQPGLSPCIAHDLYEGVIAHDVMLILNKLFSKKILSLDFLNQKIKVFLLEEEGKLHLPLLKGEKLHAHSKIIRELKFIFILEKMDKHFFKIWNLNRDKKFVVVVEDINDLLLQVVVKASQKMMIDGSNLVLEVDGTLVDEDDVLLSLKTETFILLTKDEIWRPAIQSLSSWETLSNGSTLSLSSTSSGITNTNTNLLIHDVITLNNTADANIENVNVSNILPIEFNTNMEYLWSKFMVPWEKIPADIITQCEEHKINQQNMHQLIHLIVHEMRQIKQNIPMKAFRYVAKQMVDKYPSTFRDSDSDGVVIGDGTHSLIMKLSDRNHYLNRPHKRKNTQSLVSASLKKKRLNNEAMCCNYEPPVTSITPETKIHHLNQPDIEENEEYFLLLEETYPEQRKFLNNLENPPTVSEILEKWPVLLRQSAVTWHFQKLTEIDINDIERSINDKVEKILTFAKNKKLITNINKDKMIQQCLEFYATSFREDLSVFIYTIKDTGDASRATNISTMAPCIIEFDQHKRYDVMLEKEIVNSFVAFVDALKYCFALYFIYNIEYPKKVGATLEMIQRYHLKLHPISGAKSTTTKKKVFTLMNKLKNI
ncbi:unnamed protein product [Psylliodes chrysocephalus]|uniref:CIDE-N domain-containing protein n=1 Tax=Psylliodes chrysocephalus TaxID=3402493 RepID=A0A9P0G710_9CUCU|nr:unnamed protein product [Psylliodes chrysocephala]